MESPANHPAQPSQILLPHEMRRKVSAFRNRLWRLKVWESIALACIGMLVGFFTVFLLDRFSDTPAPVRWAVLITAVVFVMAVPMAVQRWVIRRRRMDQLADLLRQTDPVVGDRLLGVIELAENQSEQKRSPALVQAAIDQVSNDVIRRDLKNAIPTPRHVRRTLVASTLLAGLACLFGISVAATGNAWARFITPWSETPRYTFTQVEALPEEMVVAHGEPFQLDVQLSESTESQPSVASAGLGEENWTTAGRRGNQYQFEMPGQYAEADLQVVAGDFSSTAKLKPVMRPELSELDAKVSLPAYLQRPEPITRSIRGGSLSVLRGSRVDVDVRVSRSLDSASADGQFLEVQADRFSIPQRVVDRKQTTRMIWKDIHGLEPGEPFELTLNAVNDQPPNVNADDLPKRKILLDSDVLSFRVFARDDYGVRRVGLQWQGVTEEGELMPDTADKLVGVGSPEADVLDLTGTFTAKDLTLPSKTIAVRLFAEDYLPGRGRSLGPICLFTVLTADEHAIWIADQLARWHRQSLDVRDRELKLYETNRELRALPGNQLDQADTRQRIAAQARAEQANGRRLTGLVKKGEQLLQEAMRNPEIGVGHLDTWAQMNQILKDISGNRMPSVADLLKKGANAESLAKSKAAPSKQAGLSKLNQQGKPSNDEIQGKQPRKAPSLANTESSQLDFDELKEKPAAKKKASKGRFGLPTTQLAGNGVNDAPPKPPADNEVGQAVDEQEALLAEFEKVAGKLNELLANMEGSTLVKRLKAASRKQEQVANDLAGVTSAVFGRSRPADEMRQTLVSLGTREGEHVTDINYIMDDMAAYYERSRFAQFKSVLDDMRRENVTDALRELSKDIVSESGVSMAMAEYWCDTLDRWAEDLVEPTMCGACSGCNGKSLPPSIVLEVLQVLEAEIKLREATREAEQAKPGLESDDFVVRANKLSEEQDILQGRIDAVIERILELPDAEASFGKDLQKLGRVSIVMRDATEILSGPETGAPAIAAETEAIELLLETKRFNPNGGGGGGASPGGGGGGDTDTPALALVGTGINSKEVREDMRAVTNSGSAGRSLPEEFRSGLDRYFGAIGDWE